MVKSPGHVGYRGGRNGVKAWKMAVPVRLRRFVFGLACGITAEQAGGSVCEAALAAVPTMRSLKEEEVIVAAIRQLKDAAGVR